jgi:hypothetical protein
LEKQVAVRGLIETAEAEFRQLSAYLKKYEAIFETSLTCQSGAKVVLIDDKTDRGKSHGTVSLSASSYHEETKFVNYSLLQSRSHKEPHHFCGAVSTFRRDEYLQYKIFFVSSEV